MIRVLIADDHPLVREGVKRIVEQHADLLVVAEAEDGAGVLSELRVSTPDVLVLDLDMPDTHVTRLIEQVKERDPALPILIISVHSEEIWAVPMLRSGASGFVSKSRAPTELVEAIRSVHAGGRYLSPAVVQLLAEEVARNGDAPRYSGLSRREFQVLCLLGDGASVKKIGHILDVSPRTVSTYRARILEKLRLHTTADLIRYVVRHELTLSGGEDVSVHDGHADVVESRRSLRAIR